MQQSARKKPRARPLEVMTRSLNQSFDTVNSDFILNLIPSSVYQTAVRPEEQPCDPGDVSKRAKTRAAPRAEVQPLASGRAPAWRGGPSAAQRRTSNWSPGLPLTAPSTKRSKPNKAAAAASPARKPMTLPEPEDQVVEGAVLLEGDGLDSLALGRPSVSGPDMATGTTTVLSNVQTTTTTMGQVMM